jgi:hypothetical protein
MAATRERTATRNGGRPAMPKIGVARMQAALQLVEDLVDEHTDLFIAKGQEFRDRYRNGNDRPFTAVEITQIAAGLGASLADAKGQIGEAGLSHHDEPTPQEVMFAAGVATAPAFLRSLLRLTALLELPKDEFDDARENDQLDEAITERARGYEDEDLDLEEMRARAAVALEHLSAATGVTPGKAWEMVTKTVTQGFGQALAVLTMPPSPSSLSGSSTDSAATTADSPAPTSSTASPGGTPSA